MPTTPFLATTSMPINGVACASGATVTSDWMPARVALNSNIWVAQTSSGTPTLTVTADYTIFNVVNGPSGARTIGTAITGITNNYRTVSVTTTGTKGSWIHMDTPPELADFPYVAIRYNITASVADATKVYLAVCQNGV
jgi:hypothetical protein